MSPRTPETPPPVRTAAQRQRRSRLLLVCAAQESSQALSALQDLPELEIVVCTDKDAALSMLGAGGIDLVLLESLADGTSMAGLCRDLRDEGRPLDVAILAFVDPAAAGAVELALASGASDVIGLQPDPALLAHRVRQLATEAAAGTSAPRVDQLTGLPDRKALRRVLAARISGRQAARTVAVILLDIDRFKKINDSLGHDFGDRVLLEFAKRLDASLGGNTAGRALGRYGGDEFALMLGDLGRVGDVAQAARKLLRALAEPLVVQGQEIFITASVGAAVAPADGETAELLLRNAETAMYAAKRAGRDTFRFYTDPMSASVGRKFDLENKLRRALERDELEVVYQPIVQARRQTLVGFEALLRWRRHGEPPSNPEEFIPMAEETGLIVDIGEWVLREACLQGHAWNRAAVSPVRVTVNISHRQLRSRGFVNSVARVLDDTGLDARLLELEITESSVVRNERETLTALHQLKVQGIRLAVDDFGTGHSALSYLKKFPLNTLKIDQSFTRGITTDADDAAIITATINMAHGLNMTVVAEGVELEEQLYFLSQHKCDEVQGFLFSLPLDAAEAGRRLQLPTWGPASS
ncbi:MAG: EAL domain-containing protein [Acidobacteriota bacterium]|nr:EAL domain-containing protein [Acidobacteriota bacterium]MDH3522239.1 EAL domain-containing protein [Acidobacteriota bacterium]